MWEKLCRGEQCFLRCRSIRHQSLDLVACARHRADSRSRAVPGEEAQRFFGMRPRKHHPILPGRHCLLVTILEGLTALHLSNRSPLPKLASIKCSGK